VANLKGEEGMTFKNVLIIFLLATTAACGSGDTSQNNDGDDGLDNGLIKYPPDSEGYVTSAFQGVKVYSVTAVQYICTVIAVRDGYEPNALAYLAKMEAQIDLMSADDEAKANAAAEASGLLLKDANNWYDINRNETDIGSFYGDKCRVPIENMSKMYGN
jgi:hypothetical protein